MDFLKKVAEAASNVNNDNHSTQQSGQPGQSSNTNHGLGFNTGNNAVDGLLGNLNGALGGGKQGEAKEDALDKAIDMFQEKVLKEGAQDNEAAAEQAKDKMIADALRSGYKNVARKDIPSSISKSD